MPEGARRSHSPRLLHLDGLRGFAAFVVVLDHYNGWMTDTPQLRWLGKILGTGWLGVDVFFTLSGFLITGILLDAEKREGYYSLFYARRLFRLAPLYYTYLAVITILEIRTHTLDSNNLLSDAFYFQDFYLAWLGHWVTGTGLLWSLAVEEQFYFVWPALVYRCTRYTLVWMLTAAGVLSVALRLYLLMHGRAFASYVFPLSHLEGICMGALLALAVRETDPFGLRRALPMSQWFTLPGLLAIYVFNGSIDYSAAAFKTVAPVLVALVTASLILRPWCMNGLLTWRPARWLGRYSYAFYVLQFLPGIPLQRWIFSKTDNLSVRMAATAFLIGMLAGEARLSWVLLEEPMMRLRERLDGNSKLTGGPVSA